ncbi:hypothetical protein PMAYCL1PPCAC_05374, partial [Pristionchus mayeri]
VLVVVWILWILYAEGRWVLIRPERGMKIFASQRLLPFPVFHSALKCQCNREKHTVFVVHTAIANKEKREGIRQTWILFQNQLVYAFCLFFFTGRPVNQIEEQSLIDESTTFKDIVIGDFVDSYFNMTIKSLFWMRFVDAQCSSTTTIIKLDDDMAINLRLLSHRLSSIKSNAIYGVRWIGMPVERENTSRWYVPYSLYPFESFQPYVSGSAYMLKTRDRAN